MQKEQYFKAQQPKLNLEAWLKSTLCGLAVGFGFNFLAATILWFAPIKRNSQPYFSRLSSIIFLTCSLV